MNLNPRQLDFLERMLEADDIVPASFLMHELKITSRTIMRDREILNDYLEAYSMHIEFQKRKGFLIISDNQKMKEELLFQLQRYRRKMISGEDESDKRIQWLFQQLVNAESELKMQDLCQKMALSRTALIRLMKEVRLLLKQYDLEIETRPYYGMKIYGDVSSIRMAKLDSLTRPYDREHDLIDDSSFIEKNILNQYRRSLIKNLIHYSWQMDDSALSKAAMLIELIRLDIINNQTVQLSEDIIQIAESSEEYKITKNVFSSCGLPQNMHEIAYFSLYLMLHRDLVHPFNEEMLPSRFKSMVDEGMAILLDEVRRKHISPEENTELTAMIRQMMILFCICRELNHFEMLDSASYRSFEKKSPVFMMLAKESLKSLEDKWNIHFSQELICRFALLLFEVSCSQKDSRRKLNIMVGSTMESFSAHYIQHRLFERYSEFLNPLQTRRLYQLGSEDLSDIDCLLVFDSGYSRRLSFPVQTMEIDMMLPAKELDRFFNEVIAFKFPLLIPFSQPLKRKIILNQEISSQEELSKLINTEYSYMNIVRETAIYIKLKEPNDSYDLCCISFSKPISLKQGKIKLAFVFNMDFDNSLLKMKNGDRLIRRILNNSWVEEALFEENLNLERIIHTRKI